jgi:hypothetical protein
MGLNFGRLRSIMLTSRNVIITLACMFFGACGGVSWMALRITGKPQVFRSLAKVVVASRADAPTGEPDQKFDFYGTIIETLESAELNREAAERVHALHPELKASGVEIRVVQTKGAAIFNVLATGSEPRYTQIFLNALLDEFMAFRQQLAEKGRGEFANIHIQERATTAAEHVDDWKMPIMLGGLGGGFLGLLVGIVVSLLVGLLGRPKQPEL